MMNPAARPLYPIGQAAEARRGCRDPATGRVPLDRLAFYMTRCDQLAQENARLKDALSYCLSELEKLEPRYHE